MALKPLFGRVLLRREKLKTKTSLLLPNEVARKNARFRGELLSCGSTCEDDIKALVGKTVLFGIYAGTWINEDGTVSSSDETDLFMCAEDDLLAVVE
jgi:co-chaperonin GroES (HSP10)